MGFAVEIEFAVDLDRDPSLGAGVLLPANETVWWPRASAATSPPSPFRRSKLLCRSQRVLGNGRIDGVRDILYVDPARFDRGRSAEVASMVAEINERLTRERRPYVLVGPGRWGSFDPWIGIPVAWHQISGARVIVEVPAKDLPMEPSQGTHFFHNMTSAGIGYFSLGESNEKEFVRWESAQCAARRGDRTRGPARPPDSPSVGAHGRPDPAGRHLVNLRCRSGECIL